MGSAALELADGVDASSDAVEVESAEMVVPVPVAPAAVVPVLFGSHD